MIEDKIVEYISEEKKTNEEQPLIFDNNYLFFASTGKVFSNDFKKMNIPTDDEEYVERFLNKNRIVADKLYLLIEKINNEFGEGTKMFIESNKNNQEIFLKIKTTKPVNDSFRRLSKIDEWFLPNMYSENNKFNINLSFN
jgi:hypothetical protein